MEYECGAAVERAAGAARAVRVRVLALLALPALLTLLPALLALCTCSRSRFAAVLGPMRTAPPLLAVLIVLAVPDSLVYFSQGFLET